jgi:uncharacterized protein (TIGR03437 family)
MDIQTRIVQIFTVSGLICAGLAQAQTIDANGVQNAAGYQTELAQGSVFIIKGSNLGPAAIVLATAPNYPQTLSGTSITFTPAAGGAAINAKMIYTLDRQVCGVLSSTLATGTYAVRVTYNNQTSAPQNVTIVARSFGIVTSNSAGTGPVQANLANVNGGISIIRFTGGSLDYAGLKWTLTAAHGGDIVTLWGTGGGADAASDAGGSSGDQTSAGSFKVIVGSREIVPVYAGTSSGYPGLWQINFALPSDINPDCYATLQVSAGGVLSNVSTISIAPAGQNACVDSQLSTALLSKLDAGGTVTGAALAVVKAKDTTANLSQEFASGSFARWNAAAWAVSAPNRPPTGQCGVYERTYVVSAGDPALPSAFLDAGATLPLSGPGLTTGTALGRLATTIGPSYVFMPALGTFKTGHYTLTGNGGADVGSFSAGTDFPGDFTVTNWDSITKIDRSQPLTFNWSGSGLDVVNILITNNRADGSSRHIVNVTCIASASAGTFTVPAAALSRLLPPPSNPVISLTGASKADLFSANLTAGGQLDFGSFDGALNVSKTVTNQ